MTRPARQVLDDVEAHLAADQFVPLELAAELVCVLPRAERERWLADLVEMARHRADPGGCRAVHP